MLSGNGLRLMCLSGAALLTSQHAALLLWLSPHERELTAAARRSPTCRASAWWAVGMRKRTEERERDYAAMAERVRG
jgi:hypothetical protein